MWHGSSNPVWATCRQLPCPVVPIDGHHALSHRSHTDIPHHSRDLHLERRISPNGCLGAYIGSNHLPPGNPANALRGGSNHARLKNNVSLHGRPNFGTGDLLFFLHELLIQLMLQTFTNTGILPGTSDGGISLGHPQIPLAGLIGIQHGCSWIKPCVGPPMHI